jgi:hypothetical protein
MTERIPQTPRSRTAARGTSLHRTVLNVAAAAAVAAALIWSALFLDLLRQRADAAATPPTAPPAQVAGASAGQPTQTPAPVTTRTS